MARACNSSIGEAKVGGSENLKPAWTIYRALTPCLRKTIFKIVLKIIDSAIKLKRQTRLFQILGFPWKHYNNIKYVCIIREKKGQSRIGQGMLSQCWWDLVLHHGKPGGRIACWVGCILWMKTGFVLLSLLALCWDSAKQSRPQTLAPCLVPRDLEPVRSEIEVNLKSMARSHWTTHFSELGSWSPLELEGAYLDLIHFQYCILDHLIFRLH